jgi:formylglycine-generating enzyme required for sulfatase activity
MQAHDPLGLVGQLVSDKYKVERWVGEGGFAVVYRAQHTIWKQPVAIKFFSGLASAPVELRQALREAFIQEGALLTQLSSECSGIVQARDTGVCTTPSGGWLPFIVLEWLEGCNLSEAIERAQRSGSPRFELTEVLGLLRQVASALDLAHARGIAHRDVKPDNLFVIGGDVRRPGAVLKLLDFGVAKLMSASAKAATLLTTTGTNIVPFTPHYGAPEQYSRAFGATGPWTDVFSLALVAVELLAGKSPLSGADLSELALASMDRQLRPTPRALGVELPEAVEAVFARALAVEPQARFTRAGELWAALEAAAAMDSAPATVLSSVRPRSIEAPPSSRRRSLRGAVGVACALGVVAGAAWLPEHTERKPSPPVELTTVQDASSLGANVVAAPLVLVPKPACPQDMAEIAPGQFFQGSDADEALPNEKPAHAVQLDGYCIDRYEVTASQYNACSEVGKCKRAAVEVDWPDISEAEREAYSSLCTRDAADKREHPINCVTWQMADLYCRAQDKRLPTEAEWEYAARGPDGRTYPWGDEEPSPERLNACGSECTAWGLSRNLELKPLYAADDGYAATAPVGHFPAGRSRFGLFDVVGNVWEWVGDWYAVYPDTDSPVAASEHGPRHDPTGPAAGERKVIRGGAWNGSYASWLRPSFRYAQAPAARSHGVGFRCAASMGSGAMGSAPID